jgi:hypothetical protein
MDILKHWHSDVARLCLLKNGELYLLLLIIITVYTNRSEHELYISLIGCSSVKGFEEVGQKFLEDIKKQGVTVINCEEIFASSTS